MGSRLYDVAPTFQCFPNCFLLWLLLSLQFLTTHGMCKRNHRLTRCHIIVIICIIIKIIVPFLRNTFIAQQATQFYFLKQTRSTPDTLPYPRTERGTWRCKQAKPNSRTVPEFITNAAINLFFPQREESTHIQTVEMEFLKNLRWFLLGGRGKSRLPQARPKIDHGGSLGMPLAPHVKQWRGGGMLASSCKLRPHSHTGIFSQKAHT